MTEHRAEHGERRCCSAAGGELEVALSAKGMAWDVTGALKGGMVMCREAGQEADGEQGPAGKRKEDEVIEMAESSSNNSEILDSECNFGCWV
jgi:hypothetical protein